MFEKRIIKELDKLEDRIISMSSKIANKIGDSSLIYDKNLKNCRRDDILFKIEDGNGSVIPFNKFQYDLIIESNSSNFNFRFKNENYKVYMNIGKRIFDEMIVIKENGEIDTFVVRNEKYLNIVKNIEFNSECYVDYQNNSDLILVSSMDLNTSFQLKYNNAMEIPNNIFNKEKFIENNKGFIKYEINFLAKKLKENFINIPECHCIPNFVIIDGNAANVIYTIYCELKGLKVIDLNLFTKLEILHNNGQLGDEEFSILKDKLDKYFDSNYILIPKDQYYKLVDELK